MKKALITGIAGQDGYYLADFLLKKGYQVHGVVRGSAFENSKQGLWRLESIIDRLTLHSANLENHASVLDVVEKVNPDECYHLAAQSFVNYSFENEFGMINSNTTATYCVLSALKQKAGRCKFYFAGSSEMFGLAKESPQNEKTDFHPRSPYGISKVVGYYLTQNYREKYNMFACTGICFNHESPQRGLEFVTRKITNAAVQIKLGLSDKLMLGNMEAQRDWGFAGEYVSAMWLMLQQDKPDDYVIATGSTHSVKEFIDLAFSQLQLDWRKYVVIDKDLFRPAETNILRGDFSKARKVLGWEPKVKFEALVKMMIDAELERLKNNTTVNKC